MSHSDPPLSPKEVLAELDAIGLASDENDPAEVTGTTFKAVNAVVADGRTPGNTKSFLTVIHYVHTKTAALEKKFDKRMSRVERLIVFCAGIVATISVVAVVLWELWKATHK